MSDPRVAEDYASPLPWNVSTEVAHDLVAALSELSNPMADQRADVPTKTGGRYSYRYAGLPSILDAVRPVLGRHNLALLQSVVPTERGTIGVLTRLQHASGTYIDFGPLIVPFQGDAQAAGAAITYGRRYGLCAVLGIAADDDLDGKPRNVPAGGEASGLARRAASAGADVPGGAPGRAQTSVPSGTEVPSDSATGGETGGEVRSGDSAAQGSDPGEGVAGSPDRASTEQWARAAAVGLRPPDIIRELQQAGIDVKKKADITSEQIEDALRPFGR